MNKLLRIVLIIITLLLIISASIHLFFPDLVSNYSISTVEKVGKREVGIWNIVILPILISIQFKHDYHFLMLIVISLFIGYIGFGTNHVLYLIESPGEMIHVFGATGNYLVALLLILSGGIERSRYEKDIKFDKKDQIKWAQF